MKRQTDNTTPIYLSIDTATPLREDFVQESLRAEQINKKFKVKSAEIKGDMVKMLTRMSEE